MLHPLILELSYQSFWYADDADFAGVRNVGDSAVENEIENGI